jgi:putative hydrolase of the HAD superfamily
MADFQWVFLDAGDTLFDVAAITDGFGSILVELGYPLPSERLRQIVDRARVAMMTNDHLGPGPEFAISKARAAERRDQLIEAILQGAAVREDEIARCRAAIQASLVTPRFFRLFPEVQEVLSTLRAAGLRLAVVSNWEPRLHLLCRGHGLEPYLEFVLTSEQEGFAKPGPRLFRRALELADTPPSQVVHVGDSYEHDVVGATNVGISAILLDRHGYYDSTLWAPRISTLSELVGLVA